MYKYFITEGNDLETEVNQGIFIYYERRAGFCPKEGCGPVATGGFSDGNIKGRVEFIPIVKKIRHYLDLETVGNYDSEIAFAEACTAEEIVVDQIFDDIYLKIQGIWWAIVSGHRESCGTLAISKIETLPPMASNAIEENL